MIIEKHILIIWNVLKKSSSNSPSVQVLHQQIRGRIKACADNAAAGGVQNWGEISDVILEHSLVCRFHQFPTFLAAFFYNFQIDISYKTKTDAKSLKQICYDS